MWNALSELFLDSDVTITREWRIQQLAASPYSLDELERILIDEVYPICRWNLSSVAGEWAGFDLEWLEKRILARLSSPLRIMHVFNSGKVFIPLSQEWRATKHGIAATRARADRAA